MVGRGSAWAPAAASCVCGQEEGPRGGSCGGREGGLLQGDRATPNARALGSIPVTYL